MSVQVIRPAPPNVVINERPQTGVGINALRGQQGPQGPAGPKGDKGDPGERGEKGDSDLAAINNHIADTTPHPAYDDLPSLTLQFENGLI